MTAPETAAPLTHRQIVRVVLGLLLGMFLASLDQTIVATAVRTIGDDLHGLSNQAWVTTAYLITSTISIPLFGKLSDIYGRKPLFMAAITVFLVGSALCGLAQSMYQLAAFRALQGIGAGGLIPLAFAILGDIVAPRQRARYQVYFTSMYAVSSVLGPVAGGFLAGHERILAIAGWRWIFWVNVPIGVAALLVVRAVLKLDSLRRDHRLDWGGAIALVVGLVPLLVIAEQGRGWGWLSASAWTCYLLAVTGLAVFIVVERRLGVEALLPLSLFRGVFAVGTSLAFVNGVAMFGGVASIPLYLQLVKGVSPTMSGLLMLPLAVGIMVSSQVGSAVIARTGRYRVLPITGAVLIGAGFLLFSTVTVDTALVRVQVYMAVIGIGLGTALQPVVLAIQNSVDPRDIGVATSASTSFSQVGGTLGTAVFLSILFSTAAANIPREYAQAAREPDYVAAVAAHPEHPVPAGGLERLDDTSFLHSLDPVLSRPFRTGLSDAMDRTYLFAAGAMLVAVALAVSLKELPLRTADDLGVWRAEMLRRRSLPAEGP